MTWFKVDDKLHDHRKTRRAGIAAMGLWVIAGSWAADNESDGFIPKEVLARWGASTRKLAGQLVAADYWAVASRDGEEGWLFHDWPDWQPTKAQKDADREAARQRMQQHRKTSRSPDVRANAAGTFARTHAEVLVPEVLVPDPTRPEPDQTPVPSERMNPAAPDSSPNPPDTLAVIVRTDVERLCHRLADAIEANGSKRPRVTKPWRDAARLMLDLDERTEAQVAAAIDWCQADEFWRANVLSMPTLRKRYDQLRLQAVRERDATRSQQRLSPGDAALALAARYAERGQ